MLKLFVMDKLGDIKYDETAFIYQEFANIHKGDRSPNKTNTTVAFKYIWLMSDYDSDYKARYEHDVRKRRAAILKSLGKEPGFVTKDMELACKKYEELQSTTTMQFLVTLRKAMASSVEFIEVLTDDVKDSIDILKAQKLDAKPDMSDVINRNSLITQVISLLNQINTLSKDAPNRIDVLDKAIKKVQSEISEKKQAQGEREIGNREDSAYTKGFDQRPDELERK